MLEDDIKQAIRYARKHYDNRHGPTSLEEVRAWLKKFRHYDPPPSKSILHKTIHSMVDGDILEGTETGRGIMTYSLRVQCDKVPEISG